MNIKNFLKGQWFTFKGGYSFTVRGKSFTCDAEHFKFWQNLERGRWEPETFEILSRFLKPEYVCFDIGTWIGPTVIYSAKSCKKVYCFEPDPVAYEFLLRNIRLNNLTNVSPMNIALSDKSGRFEIGSFGGSLGDSMTSMLGSAEATHKVEVAGLSFGDACRTFFLLEPDFIKMDTEGAEFDLIPSMRDFIERKKPVIYLSTHAPYLPSAERESKMRRVVDVLDLYGKCYDSNLNEIEVGELLNKKNLEEFASFVFTD
ncbi:MAG: FkbM family methyltransferase [Deltaproteobacteria bacterium]|nr:FkbM family methyltransferase [Deltaproteobacteria bacterium]